MEEAELEAKSKKEFSESANHLPKGKGANTAGNKKGNNDMTTSGKTGKPAPKTGNGAGMRGVVQDETSKKKPVKVYRAVRFEQRNMTQKDFVEPGGIRRADLRTAFDKARIAKLLYYACRSPGSAVYEKHLRRNETGLYNSR